MNIGVCVKQVRREESGETDINPPDLFAIEEALRLKEAAGGRVTVWTMGPEQAEKMLRKCVALGADGGVMLSDRLFAGADTLATARTLARGIAYAGLPDLLICGAHSIDGETGQVGPALAEKLRIPHTTQVVEIIGMEPGKSLVCRRRTEYGAETVALALPALITVAAGINQPRLATVKGLLKANRTEIRRLAALELGMEPKDCGQAGSPTRVNGTQAAPKSGRQASLMSGTVEEQTEFIADELLKLLATL